MNDREFQPTPSSRRETLPITDLTLAEVEISTHSLLAEGDRPAGKAPETQPRISTHSLLAEGDYIRIPA